MVPSFTTLDTCLACDAAVWKGSWYAPALRVLDLTKNSLTGVIPPSVGNATKLLKFRLSGNRINGNIPKEIDNHIEGPIPRESGKLSNLRLFDFEENYNLVGEIPKAIFNISSMEFVSLNLNNLPGRIPATTGLHIQNLKGLYLAHNQIEREIPPFIINASELSELVQAANLFTGIFLPIWEIFDVAISISINGPVPTGIGNTSGLMMLDFQKNNLMGSIPSELTLDSNEISGESKHATRTLVRF
ncbi:hypothetical protein RND71_042320 [Anisodus tanguticus]|uniref:Uncharacterized protein n=1 Tax=Anisodus tanguticus TaxID=243964 RepID=A0AAE1QS96_9SOLA|nr:hypothetical protein RND71_042320 [Anisodus tanguticus]